MFNNIPKQFFIDDSRVIKDFSKKTYNGYQKSKIFTELKKNIISGNLEKAGFWATELHCSGYLYQLYNTLFNIYIKNINKSNLSILNIFIRDYKNLLIKKENFKDLLFLRNDQFYRNHIHNIVGYLTLSPKYNLPVLSKIKQEDFVMKNNKSRLISKNLNDINKIITKKDPKNVIIPLSEILLNLKNKGLSKSLENCIFWTSWLFTYDHNFFKKKLKCDYREQLNINKKYCYDFTWIIWEIIFTFPNHQCIKELYNLYCMEFTFSKKINKLNLIVLAFMILIDPFPKIKLDYSLPSSKLNTLNTYLVNINFLYADFLKNTDSHISKIIPRNIEHKNVSNKSIFSKKIYKKNYSMEQHMLKINKNIKPKIVNKSNKINNKSNKINNKSNNINNTKNSISLIKSIRNKKKLLEKYPNKNSKKKAIEINKFKKKKNKYNLESFDINT